MKCLGFSSVQIENRLIIRGGFIRTKGNYVTEEIYVLSALKESVSCK